MMKMCVHLRGHREFRGKETGEKDKAFPEASRERGRI